MRHGSLFSGIGGFDLAAEWMGWENVFHCEWNNFGQRILKYYWPNAISYHDITKTNFIIHRGSIDILTGGFPCQPYSTAGKRLGKEDERHLWPEMLRAIREIRPRWVVGENVLGLVNWSDGLVFEEVCAALEVEGYEVQPFVLPAAGVNAPHRRDRVWFVAKNTRSNGCIFRQPKQEGAEVRQQRDISAGDSERICGEKMAGTAADPMRHRIDKSGYWRQSEQLDTDGIEGRIISDTDGKMLEYRHGKGTTGERAKQEKRIKPFDCTGGWEAFPIVSPICDGNDGISDRLDGITFSKWRQESIKGGGNAIVPQVVLQIFKAIEAYEKQ